ncbi:hypothetical protein Hte_005240 [Hypoxylon texense]
MAAPIFHNIKQASMLSFLKRQSFEKPTLQENANLEGKTAIVTGSNTGLGVEYAPQCQALGLVTQAQPLPSGKYRGLQGSLIGRIEDWLLVPPWVLELLGLGLSKLIIAVRNEPKGQEAKKHLFGGRPDDAIEAWKLDL